NSNDKQVETDDDLEDKIAKLVQIKQKEDEFVEIYIYCFETCAKQVRCIVDEHDLIYWFVSGLNKLYHSKVIPLSFLTFEAVKVVMTIIEKHLLEIENSKKKISEKPKDNEFKSNLDDGMYKDNISYRNKSNNVIIENINRTFSNVFNPEIIKAELNIKETNIEGVSKVPNDDKSTFDGCIENKDIDRLGVSKLLVVIKSRDIWYWKDRFKFKVDTKLIRKVMRIWLRIIWEVKKEITMDHLAHNMCILCFDLGGTIGLDSKKEIR
ncbi:35866_t:CDS:2, partial [Gigaspora margarita]